ncbi:hypothetical protein CU097_004948 [Rhizopus azygosporus]|uniref:UspA domain-containing protein n=1 Tax=Rhizopus azygosporus TaxID=86630 RepID=A0A367K270_RHIAZ|nr:hypothetical protein CU097_004948 [Rhizopus azygosporus]
MNPSKDNANNYWDLDAMLAQEIQELNRDSPEDRRVKEAVIVSKPDPNRISPNDDDDSDEERPTHKNYYYYSDDDDYEDDLAIRDPELFKITESNRQIKLDDNDTEKHTNSKLIRRPQELVFSEPPLLVSRDDYIGVTFHYGLSEDKKATRQPKRYMIMCDFGEESMYALKWGIGTLLRSGDEVHVASVVATDEEVESMSNEEKYRLWTELDHNSKRMISRVRTVMDEMLLYNIKIVVHSLAAQKIREALLELICSSPSITMVVCGSRDRGSLKGILMGSVSTFLVHNSPVPVSVVRPLKKTKKAKSKQTAAQKLSQSVKNGQLKVDEMEGAALSINSYDGTIS